MGEIQIITSARARNTMNELNHLKAYREDLLCAMSSKTWTAHTKEYHQLNRELGWVNSRLFELTGSHAFKTENKKYQRTKKNL